MGSAHDIILWYGDPEKAVYRKQYTAYDKDYINKEYKHKDHRGRYATFPCTNKAGGNLPYTFRGVTEAWRFNEEEMQRRWDNGLLTQAREGGPFRYKKYLSDAMGVPLEDIWTDLRAVRGKESLDYDTQKPDLLLERIIKASSDEGDIVLDPFCGCGTTVAAARRLNRQFVGIDISSFAIDVVVDRKLKDKTVPAYGIPQSLRAAEKMAKESPFYFESWAITRLPGFAPNTRQVADGGVDGRATITRKPDNWDTKLALAQVKGGKFNLSGLRDFMGVMGRDDAALGCYVTLKPVNSTEAKKESVNIGKISIAGYSFPRMQMWSIADYFDQRPARLPTMNDPYTGKPMN